MEYIHKAKAEKTRTKVLSDQMEARRVKNKVCYFKSNIKSCTKYFSGCPGTSCCSCFGEAIGYHCCRERSCRPGVNISFFSAFYLYGHATMPQYKPLMPVRLLSYEHFCSIRVQLHQSLNKRKPRNFCFPACCDVHIFCQAYGSNHSSATRSIQPQNFIKQQERFISQSSSRVLLDKEDELVA